MAQKQFIIDGGFSTNADSELVGNLEMTGHILPTVDSDGTTGYDLGSPTLKWRDLYLSQGSLYIDGQKVIESNAGTIIVTADPDQSLTTKVTGTGVLTFQSATTVSMAATLQMAAGKKITDAGGDAVTFGDKVDMDNNQIINLGAPTENGHATTKLYVDQLVGAISTDAITEGDTEIEIADLGTGTVGITVDGGQKLALSATAAAFTVPVTVNGNTLANEAYADQAEADAKSYADGIVATATTSLQTYADTAEADAVSTANAYTDTAVANLLDSAPGALDTLNELAAALGDDANFAATVTNNIATAKSQANAYADAEIATATASITTAYQTYADTAEADAVTTANAYTDTRETAITTAYQTYADTAEADANAYTDTREVAITTAYQTYSDTLNAATLVSANAYTDQEVAALIDAAPGALDTLNELAAALGDDANFAATTTTAIATAKSQAITTASDDATAKANAAQSAAEATAAADATSKANAAQAAAEATVAGANYFNALTQSHGSPVVVTAAQADSTTAVSIDLGVTGLEFAQVYLNRQLLRPTEMTNYNKSTGACTFAVGVLSTDDELEIVGFSIS